MIRIARYSRDLIERLAGNPGINEDAEIQRRVEEIIEQVRQRGDAAVLEYCRLFDDFAPSPLKAGEEEFEEAVSQLDDGFLDILAQAAENIKNFHKRQLRRGFEFSPGEGIVLGQKVTPIERVGIYVPGGTASYPSTVLMNAIPARLAGVPQLIICTPPDRQGRAAPGVLAAARIAGVDAVYKCGGAQAIAAMAYGTESIPRVYKIVGPGNIYVAAAKRCVFGQVDIDMIAGPSDVLILADSAAEPALIAADMLAQAEHDALASAVLVCDSEKLARQVSLELERRLESLPRAEIASKAIDSGGLIIVAGDMEEACECVNLIAPEHLEIHTAEPFWVLENIRNAGSVFLGSCSPAAIGDYFAGPNHTLPTMGTARFASPLSVDDFVKKSSYAYYSRDALYQAADKIAAFARAEGLEAHARSVEARFEVSG
ncbi:MAG: histidinol dehydrogenase [Oscillospiraceae bacterium]|jgi:histidinol dehydrogenase